MYRVRLSLWLYAVVKISDFITIIIRYENNKLWRLITYDENLVNEMADTKGNVKPFS